jgi:hypothetical protein
LILGPRRGAGPAIRASSMVISISLILVLLTARVAVADSVIGTLTLGGSPDGMAFDSTNGNIYVANHGYDNVSVISGSNDTLLTTIAVEGRLGSVEGAEPPGALSVLHQQVEEKMMERSDQSTTRTDESVSLLTVSRAEG